MEPIPKSSWQGRRVLFIGDSLTARRIYPQVIAEILGIKPFYHCKGGASLKSMVDGDLGLGGDYDNETDAAGVLPPLTPADVADMDMIVLYGGYNNRNLDIGQVGDCYRPDGGGQKTVAGFMQYAVNRIYDCLWAADNPGCRLLIVTVDCVGRYPWVDADAYGESTPGTGRTVKAMAEIQRAVAEFNAIPCCDLFHTSGINPHTWRYFSAKPYETEEAYTPYLLNERGERIGEEKLTYVTGNSYYQWREGKVVLEEYTGRAPYPYVADQLHKSPEGYRRIGEVIAGAMIAAYGL